MGHKTDRKRCQTLQSVAAFLTKLNNSMKLLRCKNDVLQVLGKNLLIIGYSYKMRLEGLRDSYFTSLFAALYLGRLTNFASCVFVVASVWRIFIR